MPRYPHKTWLSKIEFETVKEAAEKLGMNSVSDFLRVAALRMARDAKNTVV